VQIRYESFVTRQNISRKTSLFPIKIEVGGVPLREFKVILGLKNGKEYSFIVFSESKEEIIRDIRDLTVEWYPFVSDYIDYLVDKREIISIGIEMNEEQIFDHVQKLNHALNLL
jgi:hypothetical protein